MAQFPLSESEILSLAHAMSSGYLANPTIFPNSDESTLDTLIDEYGYRHNGHLCLNAALKLATEDKNDALDALIAFMKVQLVQAEVDTAARPTALALIGWGPDSGGGPIASPGKPRSFETAQRGPAGAVIFDWKPPSDGGPVRTYVVERRDEPAEGGAFGQWKQIGASLTPESHLYNQPQGVTMEYRVFAMNNSGESEYSATIPVVL